MIREKYSLDEIIQNFGKGQFIPEFSNYYLTESGHLFSKKYCYKNIEGKFCEIKGTLNNKKNKFRTVIIINDDGKRFITTIPKLMYMIFYPGIYYSTINSDKNFKFSVRDGNLENLNLKNLTTNSYSKYYNKMTPKDYAKLIRITYTYLFSELYRNNTYKEVLVDKYIEILKKSEYNTSQRNIRSLCYDIKRFILYHLRPSRENHRDFLKFHFKTIIDRLNEIEFNNEINYEIRKKLNTIRREVSNFEKCRSEMLDLYIHRIFKFKEICNMYKDDIKIVRYNNETYFQGYLAHNSKGKRIPIPK